MMLETPSSDDRAIWDVWLSMYWLPSVTAAAELGVFESLAESPATGIELANRLDLSERGVEVLLPMLTSLGLLVTRRGAYQLTDTAYNFLVKGSPYYWGNVLKRSRDAVSLHETLQDAIRSGDTKTMRALDPSRPPDGFNEDAIDLDSARDVAGFMQSHSLPAALGVARNGNFAGIRKLLDVGGGSGCFSIALARRLDELRCTVMDLPAMCEVAREYIAAGRVSDRVDAMAVDMFRQPWPRGYDAMFLSNIFHDWSSAKCAQLAEKAFEALPSGGRIYLHEMLLDDSGQGPRHATAFSVLMLLGTEGRQLSFSEVSSLLENAGFKNVDVTNTYGYYSLVCAYKP